MELSSQSNNKYSLQQRCREIHRDSGRESVISRLDFITGFPAKKLLLTGIEGRLKSAALNLDRLQHAAVGFTTSALGGYGLRVPGQFARLRMPF